MRRQGRHSEQPAVEMVPEYTGTTAQGFGWERLRQGSAVAMVQAGALARVAVEAGAARLRQGKWCRRWLWLRLRQRLGRGEDSVTEKPNPTPFL